MNNHEAKFILSAYRPNGSDAADPLFEDALKHAKQDPDLEAWLDREQAHDAMIVRKLAEMMPPAGLREAILAGAQASASSRSSWRRPTLLAVAAAAALAIIASGVMWTTRSSTFDHRLVDLALRDTAEAEHGGHGAKVDDLQARLGRSDTRLTAGAVLDPAVLREAGCRSVALGGRDVFEICFNRNGRWFHLYAVREPAGGDDLRDGGVRIVQRAELSCATWSDRATGYRYALVGNGGPDALKGLL